jgi:hypothetical protein
LFASVPRITRANDAYGHELWAYLTEGHADEIAERDDGFIASEWLPLLISTPGRPDARHGVAACVIDVGSRPRVTPSSARVERRHRQFPWNTCRRSAMRGRWPSNN